MYMIRRVATLFLHNNNKYLYKTYNKYIITLYNVYIYQYQYTYQKIHKVK